MTNPYVPLLIMSAAALVLAFGGLGASAILGPTKKSKTKADNYECGIQPTSAHLTEGRFPVRYYLVAMTFITSTSKLCSCTRGPSASTSWACSDWSS